MPGQIKGPINYSIGCSALLVGSAMILGCGVLIGLLLFGTFEAKAPPSAASSVGKSDEPTKVALWIGEPSATPSATTERAPTKFEAITPKPTKTRVSPTATATPKAREPFYTGKITDKGQNCTQPVWFEGTIKDKSGRALNGVTVRVTWTDSGEIPKFSNGKVTAITDKQGNWHVGTAVSNAQFYLVHFSATVISANGEQEYSKPVILDSPACQMMGWARVDFEKQ